MAKRKRTMRQNQLRQLKFIISLLLITLLAFGCSDGSDSSSSAKKGRFLDSAVEGITYESGDRSGTTDEDGTFEYDEGETVTFSVGDILLGEADGEAIVTPVDLVDDATDETNPAVTNITRFLLTLDSDEDPSNGISVPDTVRNAAVGISINFKVSISAFENDPSVQGFLANVGITILVSVEIAQNHLGSTLDDIDDDGDTFTENAGDCDDANPAVYPGAEEICGDGIDQDCDGADLICPEDLDSDDDGDTFTENAGDCDDTDPDIYPGATEICGDTID
ncbi:MAG: hypothetical protein B6245_23005, partial [Desulfobacteraceae bacterium 4572_88]